MTAKQQRSLFDPASDDRWTADDYKQASGEVLPLFDPWTPLAPREPLHARESEPEHKARLETVALTPPPNNDGQSFWFEIPNSEQLPDTSAEDWDFPALPHFDPDLHRDASSFIDFDEPIRRGARFKAKMVADLSAIGTPWERAKLVRRLEDLFEEYPSDATYRRWTEIAPDLYDVQVADLAIELRSTWDGTPEFWLYRSGPNMAPRFSESASDQLGWAGAVRIAENDPSRSVDELLNSDMLEEWRDLQGPCPGYWSFGSYIELMAVGDEVETAALTELSRMRRAHRFDSLTSDTVAPKVSRVHSGVVYGCAAERVERKYQAWIERCEKEKQEQQALLSLMTTKPRRKRRGHTRKG